MASRLSLLRKARVKPTEFGRAHSSSQRSSDQIGNTPPPSCQSPLMTLAGPPPPAGVILFSPPLHKEACVCAPAQYSCIISLRSPHAMHWMHRCHSGTALPFHPPAYYLQLIDRGGALLLPAPLDLDRRQSSSRLPIRTKRRSLDLLPQRALFVFGPSHFGQLSSHDNSIAPRVLGASREHAIA